MSNVPYTNTGHGHVWTRPDGMKARCGGPGMCKECSDDYASAANAPGPPPRPSWDLRITSTASVRIKRLPHAEGLPIPSYADPGAGAFDLMAAEGGAIGSGERKLVGTGISLEIPSGTALLLLPRSGLALKHGITLANAPGLVDSSYRGEIGLILQAHENIFTWRRGDRLAQGLIIQFVVARFQEVDELGSTVRGVGGFGSTGS